LSDSADAGNQHLTVKDAIDGSWAPADNERDDPKGDIRTEEEKPRQHAGISPEDAFAMADDAVKAGDFDLARSMLSALTKTDAALIRSRLPAVES
jgi:hypothetical protein